MEERRIRIFEKVVFGEGTDKDLVFDLMEEKEVESK